MKAWFDLKFFKFLDWANIPTESTKGDDVVNSVFFYGVIYLWVAYLLIS